MKPRNSDTSHKQTSCLDKLTWSSEVEAVAAAVYARVQYGPGDRPQPYRCKYCGKWHLARSAGE